MRKSLVVLVVVLTGAVSACASASAKTPVERPSLNVPPPPPRVIEPAVELEPEPVGDLPAAPASSPPVKPNRPARETNRNAANESKPDNRTEAAKPQEATAPPEPAPAPATPPAQLRTPQTADTSGAAKAVQATIDRARASLNTINYGPLNDERKRAYNDVKRFIVQAEEAMKQANFVFAQAVATKAETLAKELAGK